MGVENASSPLPPQRKLKLLGLHGFRTSGDILKRQLSKWSPSILDLIDLDTLDGPFPCLGKSDVEGYFEGPYYEWFRFNKDYTEFEGVEDAISFISDYMKTNGPYDGLVGFSQVLALVALSLSLYCIPAAIEFTKIYPKLAFLGLNSSDLVLEGFTWSLMNYEAVVLDWYMDNNLSIPYWYEYSY
jgi:hypothetical protein